MDLFPLTISLNFRGEQPHFSLSPVRSIVVFFTLLLCLIIFFLQRNYSTGDFFDLINPMGEFVAGYSGLNLSLPVVARLICPESVLLFLGIMGFPVFSRQQAVRSFALLSSLFILAFLCIDILAPQDDRPKQWYLVSIPILMLVISFAAMKRTKYAAYVLLGIHIVYTLAAAGFLKLSGGGGWHGASLDGQMRVYEEIYKNSSNPRIAFLNSSPFYVGGAKYLIGNHFKIDPSVNPRKFAVFFFDQGRDESDKEVTLAQTRDKYNQMHWKEMRVMEHFVFIEP